MMIKHKAKSSQSTKKLKQNNISEEKNLLIKETFDLFDYEKKNEIDVKELKIILRSLDFNYTKEEVDIIAKDYGVNNSNNEKVIKYDDFCELIKCKMFEKNPKDEIKKNYLLLCDNHEKITFKSLKKIIEEFGENMTNDEIFEMLEEVGSNEQISEEEFNTIMKNS